MIFFCSTLIFKPFKDEEASKEEPTVTTEMLGSSDSLPESLLVSGSVDLLIWILVVLVDFCSVKEVQLGLSGGTRTTFFLNRRC